MSKLPEPANARLYRMRHLAALMVTLLAAFAVRIWLLGAQNVWWDEGLAIWAVRQSPLQMTLWTASDVHPPLYFWLLQAFVRLGGESEFSARFLSLFCGVLTVAAVYALGKALVGQRIALLGTVLLTVARFHVWWSQEMRMYVVATLWGVLSLYALVCWFRAEGWLGEQRPGRQHPGRAAVLFVAATAAGLYTLYLFATVILIENIFFLALWLGRPAKRRLRILGRWAVSQLAVLGLLLPWLALALPRMHSWSVATAFDFTVFLRLCATLLTLGISTYIERYTWLLLPFLSLLGWALLSIWRAHGRQESEAHEPAAAKQTAFLFSLFLLVPPLVVYVLTRPRGLFYAPQVEARYLVLFAPVFYLLLAWSLILLLRRARWVGAVALAFVAVTFLWTLPGQYAGRYLRDEHQTMVRIIATYAEPGDAVLLVSGSRYPVFGYYYGRLPEGTVRPPVYNLPQHVPEIHVDNVEAELVPLAAAHPRLWLAQVNAPMEDPQGLVDQWLSQRYARVLSFGFAYNALTLYAPAGAMARVNLANLPPQHVLKQSLESEVTLLGYDLPTAEFRPGDTILLALYYATEEDAAAQVRLRDARGRALEQRQVVLAAATPAGRQQLDFTVFDRTPAGLYHFQMELSGGAADCPMSFGALRIVRTTSLPTAEQPAVPLTTTLEDGIELLGYTLRDATGRPVHQVAAGQALTLALFWRASHKVSHRYTVFTHLVGQAYNPATSGPVWAGQDSEPLAGGYPTSQWFVDDVIVDRHVLTVDAQAPAGDYELEAGMYLLQTMTRLSVLDAQGKAVDTRILLGHVQVVRP